MKKIIALVIILAFAATGLAAVSAGATEPTRIDNQQVETIIYQPSAYSGSEATVQLTSGPRAQG